MKTRKGSYAFLLTVIGAMTLCASLLNLFVLVSLDPWQNISNHDATEMMGLNGNATFFNVKHSIKQSNTRNTPGISTTTHSSDASLLPSSYNSTHIQLLGPKRPHPNRGKNKPKKLRHVGNQQTYNKEQEASMVPFRNVSSAAYRHGFWAGFCNQFMMFIGLMILAKEENYSQLLVESIRWKDTFGTNQQIRHDLLFDVVHWNSYYPQLPRIVSYQQDVFPHVSMGGNDISPRIVWNVPIENSTQPHYVGKKQTSAVHAYLSYSKDVSNKKATRLPLEVDIMKDAFRPHPEIQAIMDGFLQTLGNSQYMVLHARIEPDMQKHTRCMDLKVTSFRDIVRMMEDEFKDPPVSTLIVMLNRELLEKEVHVLGSNNTLAEENLHALNDVLTHGLWGGRVKVIEAGTKLAIESSHGIYSKFSTITGGIINYFISLEAHIFIGTEVSSYSSLVVKSRFFRDERNNYFYVPQGLKRVTPQHADEPPIFSC